MNKDMLVSVFSDAKLRKIKSKMIVEALKTGASERGNHKIVFRGEDATGFIIDVYYRGTLICEVTIEYYRGIIGFTTIPKHAGIYENTPATIRQRKDLKTAITELVNLADLRTVGTC